MQVEAPLAELPRTVEVAALQLSDREAVQQHRDSVVVAQALVLGEAFLPETRRKLELAGEVRRAAVRTQRTCTQERRLPVGTLEEGAVPAHALRCVAEHPELLERHEELEPELDLVVIERPAESSAQVRGLRHHELRALLPGRVRIQ